MSSEGRPASYSKVQSDIGKRLLWAREIVAPNRTGFARSCDLHPSTVAKIEAGRRAPSVFNIIAFSAKLRVDPNYFLTGSIRGVEQELLAELVARHPELAASQRRASDVAAAPAHSSPRGAAPNKRRRAKARGKQNQPKRSMA